MTTLEKILQEIEETVERYKNNTNFETVDICYGINVAKKIIKKHLSDNSGWTSVEDGLPEKPKFIDKGYIVQKDLVREPFSAYWDRDSFSDDCGKVIENVIAWRPLPEPCIKDGE